MVAREAPRRGQKSRLGRLNRQKGFVKSGAIPWTLAPEIWGDALAVGDGGAGPDGGAYGAGWNWTFSICNSIWNGAPLILKLNRRSWYWVSLKVAIERVTDSVRAIALGWLL